MWKYIDKEKSKEFLLSLGLLKDNITDKDKIIKLYSISNNVEKNYKIFKIKKRNGKYRTIYEPNYTLKEIQKNTSKQETLEDKINKLEQELANTQDLLIMISNNELGV